MEAVAGERCFEDHIVNCRKLRKGTPLIIDQVGIEYMSCGAVKDCFLKEGAVNARGPETPVELAFEARRIYDLTYICRIDNTQQGHVPGFRIDLYLYEGHHAVSQCIIRLKPSIASDRAVNTHCFP